MSKYKRRNDRHEYRNTENPRVNIYINRISNRLVSTTKDGITNPRNL